MAATVSPPPATDIILPFFVIFDRVFATDAVPTWKGLCSNNPKGPHHKTSFVLAISLSIIAILFLPISKINPSLGIFSILYSENSPPSLKLLATIASTGKIILHLFLMH